MAHRRSRLVGRLFGIVALLALAGISAWRVPGSLAASPHATVKYHNPVYAPTFPDPMILRQSAHSYYAYATDPPWDTKGLFPILHSTDLVHWKYVGNILKKGPSAAERDFWAPDVVKHGKTYYAYFTALYLAHCIDVATGSSPAGPFKFRNQIGCTGPSGTGYIDPDVFFDKDGKAYLYVSVDGPEHNISVIPLKSDLRHAAGNAKQVLGVTQAWEHGKQRATVEGPYVIRQGGAYYLFFSGNDWEDNYAMGYATGSSPTGTFTAYKDNPILTGTPHVSGPGGGSVVQGPDGKLWMAYHAWPSASRGIDKRDLRIDPLVWNGSSFSVTVTPK